MPANLREVANATVAETTARVAPPAANEVDLSDLPVYYRGDLLLLIPKIADKLAPEYVHRLIKTSPQNMATKRLKDWRPVENVELVKRVVGSLGGADHLINASGHLVFGDMELWSMPRRKAENIRRFNAARAHGDIRNVKTRLKGDFAEIAGRTGGALTPHVKE